MTCLSFSDFSRAASQGAAPAWQAQWLSGMPLRDNMALFGWAGVERDPGELTVADDTGCVHFSYWLAGGARCWLNGRNRDEEQVRPRSGVIGYAPGREGCFRRVGEFANVMVLARPETLLQWMGEGESRMEREIAAGYCFRSGHQGAAAHDVAHALYQALRTPAEHRPHPLWFQAKSLELVALFLEGAVEMEGVCIPAGERRRLMQARDRLLADLAEPISIADLARETGLNVLKLKRGFKHLFGIGVFGLFQRERMHEARRRLERGDAGVGRIAADFGYSNASHFAAAFRKEFGINPASVKGRNDVPLDL